MANKLNSWLILTFGMSFLVLFIIFSLSFGKGEIYNVNSAKCIDADNGKNYTFQGTAKYSGTFSEFYVDVCKDASTLNEFYCSNGAILSENHDCENGCFDGRCLESGQTASETYICFDTDNGKNYTFQGTAKYSGTSIFHTDQCHDDELLNEFYCSGNSLLNEFYECPYGCFDGVCKPDPSSCQDDDFGKDHDIKALVRYQGNNFTDQCASSYSLQEFFCEDARINGEAYECEHGCFDGRCLPKSDDSTPKCLDSDGDNHSIKGEISISGIRYEDSCSGRYVVEYTCKDDFAEVKKVLCKNGCSEGRCIYPFEINTSISVNNVFSWYTFDEDNSTFFGLDSSKNERTLSSSGKVYALMDEGNPAIYFDGSSYIPLFENEEPFGYPIRPLFENSSGEFTFSIWFKTGRSGVIFGQSESESSSGYPPDLPSFGAVPALYIGNDGKLRANFFWDGTGRENLTNKYVSEKPVTDSKWHFFSVSYNDGNEELYLDGEKVYSKNHSQRSYSSKYVYTLGMGYSGGWDGLKNIEFNEWSYYTGFVDKLVVFQRALNSNEVAQLYYERRNGTFIQNSVSPDKPVFNPENNSKGSSSSSSSGGGSSSGGSSSGGAITGAVVSSLGEVYSINSSQIIEGYSHLLKKSDIVRFIIDGEFHTLNLLEIKADGINVEVNSNPQRAFIYLNKTESFDFNSDKFNDLNVTLNGFSNGLANVSLIYVNESNQVILALNISDNKDEKKNEIRKNSEYYLSIVFFILVIALVLLYMFKKKNFSEEETKVSEKISSTSGENEIEKNKNSNKKKTKSASE